MIYKPVPEAKQQPQQLETKRKLDKEDTELFWRAFHTARLTVIVFAVCISFLAGLTVARLNIADYTHAWLIVGGIVLVLIGSTMIMQATLDAFVNSVEKG